ncbi:MAG: biopolymer transporter ExbD [Bacteroidota bacterium]
MARETPEVNGGSLADIAFLLLIFFLVTTTMDIDTGITRLLPPEPEEDPTDTPINRRNVMVVLINKSDRLMVDGQEIDPLDLKDKTIKFFSNEFDDPDLPVMEPSQVEFPPASSPLLPPDGLWKGKISKGVISLQNDRSTTYGRYLSVQNEIVAAVNQLRNEFCRLYFDMEFDLLNTSNPMEKQIYDGIREIYKMNISESEPKKIN